MSYQPIEDYGIIGNMRTVALVGMNGSIDWHCSPNFDSPSIFGALLDDAKGGRFQISPIADHVRRKQFYWPSTNILVTRFSHEDGITEIEDFMPVGFAADSLSYHQIHRRVRCVRGPVRLLVQCRPAFDYGRQPHELQLAIGGANFYSNTTRFSLATDVALKPDGSGGVTAEFVLEEGQSQTFIFQHDGESAPPSTPIFRTRSQGTVRAHRKILARLASPVHLPRPLARARRTLGSRPKTPHLRTDGRYRRRPHNQPPRSHRRFAQLGLPFYLDPRRRLQRLRLGAPRLHRGSRRLRELVAALRRQASTTGSVQLPTVFTIYGEPLPPEESLDHWEGYMGSAPVRIGNAASDQYQSDIYGELMDSLYLYNKYVGPIAYDFWVSIRHRLDWICDNWQKVDEGIWEVRSGRQDFVYSKLMNWVALDRGIRLADKRSFPGDRQRWMHERDAIYEEIMTKGWNDKRKAFTQFYGSDDLDASVLIMPLVFFMAPTDPRMVSTLKAILENPRKGGLVSDGLVYRYPPQPRVDGLPGEEGTFNMCSFWLVEALTRAGQVNPDWLDEARLLFERMLGYANHLGLYAEQTSAQGEALGNFPQAFTHLALISSAFNLDRTLGSK